jgi:NosL
MRTYTIVFALLMAAFVITSALAAEEPTCENCGMFWNKSESKISASIKQGAKSADHKYECFNCLKEGLAGLGKGATLGAVKIVDYPTVGTKSEKLIDARKAWFLYGTSRLKGSMAPYIAGFGTKDAATKAKATLGGEVLDWDGMWGKLTSEKQGAKCGCAKCEAKGVACDNCADCKKKDGCECCKDKDKS